MTMGHRNEGIALIWSILMLMVIALFVGLSIDTGYYVWAAQELQITADASALGGAALVRTNAIGAHWKAREVGLANNVAWDSVSLNVNFGNAYDGDVSHGSYDRLTRTFDTDSEKPNAVRVIARRTSGSLNGPLPTLFGDIFGVATIDIARDAIAKSKGGIGVGILVLDADEPCAFDVRGTSGSVTVNGGAIYVDSNSFEAACHSGRPTVDAQEMYVVGDPGLDGSWDDQVNFEGDMYVDEPYLNDPLALLPEPNYNPLNINVSDPVMVSGGDVQIIGPGYFPSGINQNGGDLTLLPGVYVLDGIGLNLTGGFFSAEGVMLYIVDTTPGNHQNSRVNLVGNGETIITGMSPMDYPAGPEIPPELVNLAGGVPIFQARDNTNDSRINGSSRFTLEGTIYMPSNHLLIQGRSDSFAWGLIANTLQAKGGGVLNIDYHGQFPPLPLSVYLVE